MNQVSIISWTEPLSEKAPLNARITGRLERREHTVEKILFESIVITEVSSYRNEILLPGILGFCENF